MSEARRPPLEALAAAVRAKLVRGERVSASLIGVLDGLCPGWRGHDDLMSLIRSSLPPPEGERQP